MARKKRKFDDSLVFAVCEQFLHGQRATDILADLGRRGITGLTRESVYFIVREGVARQFLHLRAPKCVRTEHALRTHFPSVDIHVVDAARDHAVGAIVGRGVEIVLELIAQLAAERPGQPVQIGLGGGATTQRFAARLRSELAAIEKLPVKLVFQAMTSGFYIDKPTRAPTSFIAAFEELHHDVGLMGLFAPAFVKKTDYARLRRGPRTGEAFKFARDMDIVITSLASAGDAHSEFQSEVLAMPANKDKRRFLENEAMVGDIMWRPFSAERVLDYARGIETVTLLELEDLYRFCQTGKHVICLAAPCAACHETKESAAYPLLASPRLRLVNHLVTCRSTGERLLALHAEGTPG